jgi:dTMP kinase
MFVTFEGVDGSGKTTQAELLADWLRAAGRRVVTAREPGETVLGESVRALVLHGDEMSPWAEAALFAAARAELVARVIRPALEQGADAVVDRYLDSSVAYQGIGRGLGAGPVRDLSLLVTGALLPDRTFVLAVEPDEALARSSDERDRIEREDDDFMRRVDDAYRSLAADEPGRIVLLDGAAPPQQLAEEVREHLRPLL